MENSKTNEQIQRTGRNTEPTPKKVISDPKETPLADRKPLKKGQQQLNDSTEDISYPERFQEIIASVEQIEKQQ